VGLWLTSDGLWLCCCAMNGGDGGELHRCSRGKRPAYGCHASTAVADGTALPLRASTVDVAASAFEVVTFFNWRGGWWSTRHGGRVVVAASADAEGGACGRAAAAAYRRAFRRHLPPPPRAGMRACGTAEGLASALTAAMLVDAAVTQAKMVWVGPTAAGAAGALGPLLHRVPWYGGLWAADWDVLRLP